MKNKKLLITLSVGAVLLVAGILELTHVTNFLKLPGKSSESSQGPTPEQLKQEAEVNAEAKKQFIENGDSEATSGHLSSSKAIELSAKQEANNTVTVFTKLLGYSDGTCKLTVTNGAQTTTQEASVIFQREASLCAGFSVPVDTIGKGRWTLALAVTSNGSTETQTMTQEVK